MGQVSHVSPPLAISRLMSKLFGPSQFCFTYEMKTMVTITQSC